MKDSLPNMYFPFKAMDSIHNDLSNIRSEIAISNKLQNKDNSFVTSDTVFTVFITILIFIIGVVISRIEKWYDKKKKEKERIGFFNYHIERANQKMVLNLKDVYLGYSKRVTLENGITSTPPKVISSDFQRILNTNYEDLFEAYTNKEVFSKILSLIEYIDKVQKNVEFFHEKVYADTGLLGDKLNILTDEYMSLLAKYLNYESENNNHHKDSETYKLVSSSVELYYKSLVNTRQISVFYTDVLRAIQDHIVQTDEYKNHIILKDVAESGRKLSHLINTLKSKMKEIQEEYEHFSEYMDYANKNLDKFIPQLK